MVFILGYVADENGKTIKSSNLLQEFRKHIISVSGERLLNFEFISNLKTLTDDYRNKAAHISQIENGEAKTFLSLGKNILNELLNSLK